MNIRTDDGSGAEACVQFEDRGYDTTIIAFSGIAGRMGLPEYEWKNITSDIAANIVFVRDPTQSWYQAQLGVSDGGFRSLLARAGAIGVIDRSQRTVAIGNSMGGFAALCGASSLGVDRVLAFAPQTFIDPVRRLFRWDRRWPDQISQMYTRYGLHSKSYDARYLIRSQATLPRTTIFIGTKSRLDALHAKRLAAFENVKISVVVGASHDAVSILKQRGALSKLLLNEVD